MTTTGRELPNNAVALIKSFLAEAARIRIEMNYIFNKIYNMDETSIYLDYPSNYTYAYSGAKRVKANTGGGERTRISAAFGASATGQKLPIFMIIPRSTPLVNEDGSVYEPPENVLIRYKTSGTFNQDVIIDYFQTIKVFEIIEDGISKIFLFDFLLNIN